MKKEMEKFSESFTLNMFKNGAEPKNFEILRSLPTTVKMLGKKLHISKMPINRRLNELEKYGLIRRERQNGWVKPTNLTIKFVSLIGRVNKDVNKNLFDFLNKKF